MTQSGDAAEGYRGLGMTYYEMEDYENALESFRQAAENGAKQTIQMYNLMGICAMQTEDYKSALGLYTVWTGAYEHIGWSGQGGRRSGAGDEVLMRSSVMRSRLTGRMRRRK